MSDHRDAPDTGAPWTDADLFEDHDALAEFDAQQAAGQPLADAYTAMIEEAHRDCARADAQARAISPLLDKIRALR